MNTLENETLSTKLNALTSSLNVESNEDYYFFEKAQELSCDKKYDDALITIKEALKMNAIHEDELSLMYASDYLTLKGQIELHLNDYDNAYKSFESVANNPTCYDELKTDMESMMYAIEAIVKKD